MAETNGSETNGNLASRLRQLVLPAAVSLAGAGVGLVLSNRSKLKESVPDVKEGVGDLTTDLRNKLDAVLGKNGASPSPTEAASRSDRGTDTRSQFAARRRERQERREARRATS